MSEAFSKDSGVRQECFIAYMDGVMRETIMAVRFSTKGGNRDHLVVCIPIIWRYVMNQKRT